LDGIESENEPVDAERKREKTFQRAKPWDGGQLVVNI
jgi:hypothetical protein